VQVVGFCENSVPITCVEVLGYPRIVSSQQGLCSMESKIVWFRMGTSGWLLWKFSSHNLCRGSWLSENISFSKRTLLHGVKNSVIQDRDKWLAFVKIQFP